jgi:hypothetical protein
MAGPRGKDSSRAPRISRPIEDAEFVDIPAKPAEPAEPENDVQDAAGDDDVLGAILETIGTSGAKVQLYKIENGDRAFCETFAASDFDLDTVREKYGPGQFEARFKKDGRFLKPSSTRFRIAGVPQRPAVVLPTPSPLDARIEKLEGMIERIAQGGAAQTMNPMELAAQFGAIAAQNMTSMIAVMQTLQNGNGGGKKSDEDELEKFMRMFDLVDKIRGDGGGGGSGMDWGAIANVVTGIVDRAKTVEAAQPNAPALPPGPTPTPEGDMRMMSRWLVLRKEVPKLLQRAAAGKDPELYASLILEEHPQAVDALVQWIESAGEDAVLTEFYQVYPDCTQFRPWFDALFEALTTEDADDEGVPEGAG